MLCGSVQRGFIPGETVFSRIVMSSIPSTGCPLSCHTVARSVVSVAAQHTGRILLLPRSSVGSSHGAGSVATRETGVPRCSVGVFLLGWCKKFQRLWRRVTSRSFTVARLHPVLSGGKRPRASLPRKDITHLRQGDVPHSLTVGYFILHRGRKGMLH